MIPTRYLLLRLLLNGKIQEAKTDSSAQMLGGRRGQVPGL